MFRMIFDPIKIGGVEIKNRLIVPPMVSNFCTNDGNITERFIKYHEAKAKGGWGLITIEQTVVSKSGKGHPNQPALWDDTYIGGLLELTDRVHTAGAKICVQLNHAGRSSSSSITGSAIVSSSAIKDPNREEVPLELREDEIKTIVEQFGDAALRAKKAGFDMIMEHAHARYLIASFLSPTANKRTDRYGGSLINRARFAVEVLQSMRAKVGPDFPIIFRFSADEFVEGGLALGDTIAIAQIMEEAGADAIDISVGNSYSPQYITPPAIVPHAFLADISEQFKKAVSIPIIIAGRINDPFIAESILRTDKADLISMGRASIADPEFPNKVKEGRFEDIIYCIGCLQGCIESIRTYRPLCCLANPLIGREEEYAITKAVERKTVLVIGGGVAGMEAAIIASKRGHDVSIYEKMEKLGGNWLLAAIPPGKTEYNMLTIWQKDQLKQLGVKVHLETEATVDMIKNIKPDAVIVATGAVPITPDIKGISCDTVMQAFDVLNSKAIPGKKAVVVGGGLVGSETALFLAVAGVKVYLLEMFDEIAKDGIPSVNYFLFKYLNKYGVEIITSATVSQIKPNSVVFEQGGEVHEITGIDNTIIAIGVKAFDPLSDKLRDIVENVQVIGDASKARKALEAVQEGYIAGMQI